MIKPMEHQLESLAFMADKPRVFDMSSPGTGKTFVEIEDFFRSYKDNNDKCLVLAPKSLLESAWGEDIAKFRPELSYSVAWAENRAEAFEKDADIYITNIDAATWLAKQPAKFFKRFDRLVIDESTNFKHPTSQRSKAVAKIAKHFGVRRCMSGTARGNKLTDIWHQAYILDDGKRLGNSFFKFRAASCDPVQRGPGAAMVEWVERPGAAEAVATLLSDISIRHELERCADIPDNHQYTVAHKLPRKLQKVYNEMEMASVAEFKGKIISAPNAAVVANKLLQIASGAVYAPQDEEGEGSYQLLDNSRYNLIGDLIEEREHSIVFFHWRHQRDELMRVCQARNIPFCLYDGSVSDKTRAQVKKDYQAGFYQVMLAHPKSAGHGLTLTRGTATIWASPTHNHELFQQGLQRVYRNTQKQKTENIIIVAPGTVDEFALARCLDRGIKATELHAYLGG